MESYSRIYEVLVKFLVRYFWHPNKIIFVSTKLKGNYFPILWKFFVIFDQIKPPSFHQN